MGTITLDQVLEVERAGWDSLCESRGGSFYGDLMMPDALMVLVNGMVLDRGTVAATLNDAPPWARYEISEPRLVGTGPKSAALVYRAHAERDGEEPFVALMASHYRTVDDRIRLDLYQQTTITH